jgi:hypothetical protein
LGYADWADVEAGISSRLFPGLAHLIPGSAKEFPGSVGYGKLFESA